jgi:hypothetical protein
MGGPGMGGPGMGHMGGMKMRMGAMGLVMAIVHEADPQRTGTVTHDGFTAAALRLFDKADTNHDGKLSPEERRAAHRMMGGGQHRGMRGMKGMGDHDHDGGDKPMSGH